MQFLYDKSAGASALELKSEGFSHLKAQRLKQGSVINVCNLLDSTLYCYKIISISRHSATLELESSQKAPFSQANKLHLLWAICEPKIIDKALPHLNELGVAKISLFYSAFSQRHFKPNLARMQKILISSSQQCGRTNLMELEMLDNFKSVCDKYAPLLAFDFGGENIKNALPDLREKLQNEGILRIIIGAEGGFSASERAEFAKIITLNDTLILKSESAAIFIASVIKLL